MDATYWLAAGTPPRLPDGRPLFFGPVTPASRPLIERAMTRLSPETSRRRFFTVRYRLSDRECARLLDDAFGVEMSPGSVEMTLSMLMLK